MHKNQPDHPNVTTLQPGDLVDEREFAEIIDSKVATVRNWRSLGKGPPFIKIGERMVRHRRSDIEQWLASGGEKAAAA
jgi:predicted DNA-binding transcriptional regulator AlpA